MIKTKQPKLSIIVCVDSSGGFAKDGKIPWNIPEDLKHFKKITSNGVCIMGRKTYVDMCNMMKMKGIDVSSIKDILPNRKCFVVTRDNKLKTPGATKAKSIRGAWQQLDASDNREIFIIGGERMYIEALAFTTKIYMNVVKQEYGCNLFFPINIINSNYMIIDGQETDTLYKLQYQRIVHRK